MNRLLLLFTQDGLQYQISKSRNVLDENSFFVNEETPPNFIAEKLDEILKKKYDEISVISALNRFAITPLGFSQHDAGYPLISYNSHIQKENEELMLSINHKYKVQFYYSIPKEFYHKIKNIDKPTHFNFSGEKFLNTLQNKQKKEIHINLYHHQCEFLALDKKELILYNNLDVNSEVDFLYFIMFTLSKINFGLKDTYFYVYGETTENETFISELRKFVKHLRIVVDNIPKRNFILNY